MIDFLRKEKCFLKMTAIFSYKAKEQDTHFLNKKLMTYCDGYVRQAIMGELVDAGVTEFDITFTATTKTSVKIEINLFLVDLEPEENESLELTLRESFAALLDSYYETDRGEEVSFEDPEMDVKIIEAN